MLRSVGIFEAIILGIVQGVTEFLPVSSSAHLLVLPILMGWTGELVNSLFFDVALHAGTLFAVLAYFRSDLIKLVGSTISLVQNRKVSNANERMVVCIFISAFPAGLAGVFLKDFIEVSLRSPVVVVVTLVVVGIFMYIAERYSHHDRLDMTLKDAVVIGCCQALALIPGVSRSGITISTGIMLGLDRNSAARFSFLMAIPVIAGATLLQVLDVWGKVDGDAVVIVLTGVLVSFLSGYLAISCLLNFVKKYSFDLFVYYRVLVAVIILFIVVI